jgi:hypothetical protein
MAAQSFGGYTGRRVVNDDDDDETRSDGEIQIFVKTLSGKTITLDVNYYASLEHVKDQIRDKEGILPDQQRLIFEEQRLEDGYPLFSYNIVEGSVLSLIVLPEGQGQELDNAKGKGKGKGKTKVFFDWPDDWEGIDKGKGKDKDKNR